MTKKKPSKAVRKPSKAVVKKSKKKIIPKKKPSKAVRKPSKAVPEKAVKSRPEAVEKTASEDQSKEELKPSGNTVKIDFTEQNELLDSMENEFSTKEEKQGETGSNGEPQEERPGVPPPSPSDEIEASAEEWFTDEFSDLCIDGIHGFANKLVLLRKKRVNPYTPEQREKIRIVLCKQAGKINMPALLAKYMPRLGPFIAIIYLTAKNVEDIDPVKKEPATESDEVKSLVPGAEGAR